MGFYVGKFVGLYVGVFVGFYVKVFVGFYEGKAQISVPAISASL